MSTTSDQILLLSPEHLTRQAKVHPHVLKCENTPTQVHLHAFGHPISHT